MFCDNISILKHGNIFKLLNTEYKVFLLYFPKHFLKFERFHIHKILMMYKALSIHFVKLLISKNYVI